MSSDQRLQFEYIQPIFPEVNFINQNPRNLVQSDYPNQIISTYSTTSNGLFSTTSGTSGEDFASIQLDTDEVDFAPTPDGELTSGCRKCGIDYGSSTELKLHFGAVHSRQTFECCVCNKLFIRRHGFLVHIKRFHEDVTARSYPCPFCEQIYTNPDALNEHCAIQHKDPSPICPLCSTHVPDGGMKHHISSEHSILLQQPCEMVPLEEQVPVIEENKLTIKVGKRKWPLEKSHQCSLCPYETNRAERLRVHIQGVHNDQRAFSCQMCDKSFKQKDKLNRHIASVHLGQRPFACDYCQMSFGRKDEQTRHVRIVHLGEKPKKRPSKVNNFTSVSEEVLLQTEELVHHQCPHCPYHCERSDKLKVHLVNMHSTEKPFACNFCDKRFKLKDKLNLHMNTVHLKRKPFQCDFCSQVFGRKDAAKRHEKKWCPMRPKND